METHTHPPNITHNPSNELDKIAEYLKGLKDEQARIKDLIAEAEERVTALVGVKEEGTITQRTESWKVSTTGGLNRSLDTQDPDVFKEALGDEFSNFITTKLALNLRNFRTATDDIKAKIMNHMTIKPRKVAIKIEPREDD